MRTVFSGEVNIQLMLSDLTETLLTKSQIKLVDSSKKILLF